MCSPEINHRGGGQGFGWQCFFLPFVTILYVNQNIEIFFFLFSNQIDKLLFGPFIKGLAKAVFNSSKILLGFLLLFALVSWTNCNELFYSKWINIEIFCG